MAAIGTTSSRARFGLAASSVKANQQTDEQSQFSTVAICDGRRTKNVRKAAGGQFGWCMQMLGTFAFAEYSVRRRPV
jgi:hypothetical protein